MGKTAHSLGPEVRPDPVRSFNRWKKKHSYRQNQKKQLRKQLKKPEWQVEREGISRLVQNYEKINVNAITRFSDFPLSKKTLKAHLGCLNLPGSLLDYEDKGVLNFYAYMYKRRKARVTNPMCSFMRLTHINNEQHSEALVERRGQGPLKCSALFSSEKAQEEDLKHEAERINNINILVCTPGRLLQHMDETICFHATDLQMLVDEPTQMRFCRWKPIVSMSTPATLEQNYIVCELQQKISVLYSFLRSHLKKKSIIFFSSCKEVQYLYRVFCRLRPGISILALHGRQQQMRRMEVYNEFVRKRAAVLFATDIAARGLDFPAVNWVLQFDCPEDANTYIHRAGRTARYKEDGEALLILLPSEEQGMVQQLFQKKVPVKQIKINPEKLIDVQKKLESFLAQDQDLKERAQRCFVSYIRSVYLMKNKEVFDVSKLPITEYALSLGLAVAPRIRFLQKMQKQFTKEGARSQANKTIEHSAPSLTNEEVEEFRAYFSKKMSILQEGGKGLEETEHSLDSGSSGEEPEEGEKDDEEMEEKPGKERGSQTQSVPNTDEGQEVKDVPVQFLDRDDEEEDGPDDDFLKVKRRDVFGLDLKENKALQKKESSKSGIKKKVTKVAEAKKIMKRNFKVNKKITFTDDGELVQQWPQMQKSATKDPVEDDDSGGINLDKAKERLQEEDKFDKEEYRKKIKAKHREKRLKEREARREANKRQAKGKDEEEAFLDWSDDDSGDGFDPSTLPDPDKHRSSEESDSEEIEDKLSDAKKKQGIKKRNNSEVEAVGPASHHRKKAKWETLEPLDTGLSLAEDEELVLHLLRSQS
ncbi:probable ATP-dependent RNA helicase DDX10 [Octodon degus]|uniref:ATP-dependent RNA helicase n=1 Tax=Octodon degus TaxID=10160 RepID=A0A6P3EXZ2_OCTDE|nr:probable ATP-dependent RNA helicase DDX10 [Octodon degus]